ncbi:DUF5933 domain-containing protein [Streptomyces sp. NPDC047072]|uniref:phosphatase PAP2 family protein n=1 Tax=Streptomyces sp. NPDC047072 TaxID=3154809 RepID=UPI0033E70205
MALLALLGLLVALEFTARHYGIQGPLTGQLHDLVFPPRSGTQTYGGLALTMVVLTWRQRFTALGAAVGLDLAYAALRWAAGIHPHHGHSAFGNGALWVMLGIAVLALTRRTGPDRVLLLKGAGLGLLMVVARKIGDTWLLITAKSRPMVLDEYVAVADHALGNPSWVVGRLVEATGAVGYNTLDIVYGQLAVAAVCVALYQMRNVVTERRFPRHHLVRTFLAIGAVGPAVYMVFPVVGPLFAYGTGTEHWAGIALWSPHMPPSAPWAVADLWPHTTVPLTAPHAVPFDGITPRNCMPSLHTAWATTIFVHSRKGPRAMRYAGTFWLVATLTATLGFGYHYGADLLAGVVFALTVEAALRTYDRAWDRQGLRLVAYGTTVFTALLLSYRFLPVELAEHRWLTAPLLLLATASVILAYVRTTTTWEPSPAPARHPEPQPELI